MRRRPIWTAIPNRLASFCGSPRSCIVPPQSAGSMTLPICSGYRAKFGASRLPRCRIGAMDHGVRAVLQLSIDDVVDERDIVDDGEMGPLADMYLQA
jgi:hypothetical protein